MKRIPVLAVLAVLPVLPGGCVAVNMGEPSLTDETKVLVDEAKDPVRVEAIALRATHEAPTSQGVLVGLEGDLRAEYPRTSRTVTTTRSEQRRLAFGLFPGAAEEYCLPPGAENRSCTKPNYPTAFMLGVLPAGLFVGLGTVRALLWELPCGRYDCWREEKTEAYSHVGLAGFHNYTVFVTRPPEYGPERPETPNFVTTPRVRARGPYIAELTIPGLGISRGKTVGEGETGVSFQLPEVQSDCTEQATVVFRPVPGRLPSDDASRRLLEKAEGRPLHFMLHLHAPPRPFGSGGVPPPYEIREIQPLPDGKYVVRVAVHDKSKTYSIGRQVEMDVKRQIRGDYMGKHPEIREGYVSETVQWKTDGEGGILVFTGWAFSVQPEADGWAYDAGTRRGTVRLRITGGMPAEEARRWAKANIEAIVQEKNVVLQTGEAPPPGAMYRSLGEEFRDGVLTVEFEAVE